MRLLKHRHLHDSDRSGEALTYFYYFCSITAWGALFDGVGLGVLLEPGADGDVGPEAEAVAADDAADAEVGCMHLGVAGQAGVGVDAEVSESAVLHDVAGDEFLFGMLDHRFHASHHVGAGEGAGVGDVVGHLVEGVETLGHVAGAVFIVGARARIVVWTKFDG